MRAKLNFQGNGYASILRDKIEAGASAITYMHPHDIMSLRIQMENLSGIIFNNDTLIVELNENHPQGFGNSFTTSLVSNPKLNPGTLAFSGSYPNEEFLGYDILGEEGFLLTESGELIIIA